MVDITKIAAIYADAERYGGMTVTVGGWAKTIRDLKTFGFIELNDGSCFRNLQVVMSADELHNYKEIAGQNVGAALIVRGTVVLTPEAKQPLELRAAEIAVEGRSTPDYPLQKKRHSVCVPGPICFPLPSGFAARRPMPCMSSSRAGALCMSTPPSSPGPTARAQARCSR